MSDSIERQEDIERIENNHKDQVQKLYSKIKHLKKLYAVKLPKYHEQLHKANKNSLLKGAAAYKTSK